MVVVTKEEILKTSGSFTWFWGADWFIETSLGNFHWIDNDYLSEGAVSTITPFAGTYHDFCQHVNVQFGRDKGIALIADKCGLDWSFLES